MCNLKKDTLRSVKIVGGGGEGPVWPPVSTALFYYAFDLD